MSMRDSPKGGKVHYPPIAPKAKKSSTVNFGQAISTDSTLRLNQSQAFFFKPNTMNSNPLGLIESELSGTSLAD